jgi:hypothetical protein
MFSFFLPSKKDSAPKLKQKILLIVVPDKKTDFVSLFGTESLQNGQTIRVIEAQWNEMNISVDFCGNEPKCFCYIGRKPFIPDFCLIRSEVRGVTPEQDFRNLLYGLMYGNVPTLNSLHSIYCFLERPVIQAELVKLMKKHGAAKFPIVHQSYFPTHREMMYGNSFPAVIKVGHAHAGYGKMKLEDHHVLEDFQSVLALNKNYATIEPFINGSYDLRIQKIGSNVRVFKRISVSGNWKTNNGSSHCEELMMTDEYQFWIQETSQIFDGLDICTVDVIHDGDTNKNYIMEINGTASGFFDDQDNQTLKELILQRMNEVFCHCQPKIAEIKNSKKQISQEKNTSKLIDEFQSDNNLEILPTKISMKNTEKYIV